MCLRLPDNKKAAVGLTAAESAENAINVKPDWIWIKPDRDELSGFESMGCAGHGGYLIY